MVERSVAALLRWSCWRRWHQAWACFYHYRRREEQQQAERGSAAREARASGTNGEGDAPSTSDVVEVVWQRVQALLPSGKRRGRPYTHDRRVIVEAIMHQRQTGCAWNALPSDFPPYQTVHTQLRSWQKSGLWSKEWEGLE